MPSDTCEAKNCFFCRSCLPAWSELTKLRKTTYLFRKGASIIKEGEPVTGIFFTHSGAVKVHKVWGDRELILRFIGGGDIVGLRGGLSGVKHYPVTATALELTKACFIPNDFLETSLRANPELSYQLMHFYASELIKAEDRMSELAHLDVKGRVLKALIALMDAFGMDDHSNIRVPISRQDIASYAGTTYETVFKVFNDLIASSIISTEGKLIKILKESWVRSNAK